MRVTRGVFTMKWYFGLNEGGTRLDLGDLAKLAVTSARRFTNLRPHMLYHGNRNAFTAWMEREGVTVIDVRLSYEAAMKKAIRAGWYPAPLEGHWLRTEICNIECEDEYVLYTDIDVVFLKPVDLTAMRPRFFACAPEFDKDNWNYFNSGVMVMNIPALRADYLRLRGNIEERFRDPANGAFNDQPVYNTLYQGLWDRLDPIYNWKPYWSFNSDAAIFHFHGPKFDTIREIIDGTWNWENLYGERAGTMVVGHFDLYLTYFRMMRDLTEPGGRLHTMIEGILRDGPGALPAMWEIRAKYVPEESGAPPPVAVAPPPAEPQPAAAPIPKAPIPKAQISGAPPALPPALDVAPPPPAAASVQADSPIWVAQGTDAWLRSDGTSIVFWNGSARGGQWVAGLRGQAAALVDPTFLTDPLGRIRAFPSAAAARAACDATLAGAVPSDDVLAGRIARGVPGETTAEAAWP